MFIYRFNIWYVLWYLALFKGRQLAHLLRWRTINPRNLFPVKVSKEAPLALGGEVDKDYKSLFGGDLPSNEEKHTRALYWDGIQRQNEWTNFVNAAVQPGYGPNAKVVKDFILVSMNASIRRLQPRNAWSTR
jgi:hypothetical protein